MSIATLLDRAAARLSGLKNEINVEARPIVPPDVREEPLEDITKIREPKRPKIKTVDIGLQDNSEYLDTDIGTRNILAVYDQATPSELEFWSDWYIHAHEDVKRLAARYGMPFGLTAAVVAITSPGNKWAMNLRAAERAIRLAAELIGHPEQQAIEHEIMQLREESLQGPSPERLQAIRERLKTLTGRYKEFGQERGISINTYPMNIRKAVQVIDSEDPAAWVTGPKVQPFLAALLDPHKVEERMVLDGHALNLWTGLKRSLKEALDATQQELRAKILKSYADAAKARNTNTRALQAVTWYIWKSVYDPKKPVLDSEDIANLNAA
jgi:hypothetical protein